MKIYSIKEIIKASNNIFTSKKKYKILIKKKIKIKKKLPSKTTNIIINTQKNIIEKEESLLLKVEAPNLTEYKKNSFNYKIKIKPEVKDHMINELYLYLKKKIKKNTLKLIIDEQLEIKNLKNKINLLKQIESVLKNNYESSLRDNEILVINEEKLEKENKELKVHNSLLHSNLAESGKDNEKLHNENKELKIHNDNLDTNKIELKIENDLLNENINQVIHNNEKLDIKNKELKNILEDTKNNLEESNLKNKSYEINNHELNNTVSRYVNNAKTIQEKLNLVEQSKNSKLDEHNKKVKFYQEENIRLSAEVLYAQKKNETIKENLHSIETEKEEISNKIKELNHSIDEKTNIIPSSFSKTNEETSEKKIDTLNDKEQKSLDEVINRIFAKI